MFVLASVVASTVTTAAPVISTALPSNSWGWNNALSHEFGKDTFSDAWKTQFTSEDCTVSGGADCAVTWPGTQPTVFVDHATTVTVADGLTIVLRSEDNSEDAGAAREFANAMEEIDSTQACECGFRESTTGIIQSYQKFGPGFVFETSFKVEVTMANANNGLGTVADSVASIWLQSTEAEVAFGVRGNTITLAATAFGESASASANPEEKVVTLDGFDVTELNNFSLWWDPTSNDILLYVNENLAATIPGSWAGGVATDKMMLMADLQIYDMVNLTDMPAKTELTVKHVSVFKASTCTNGDTDVSDDPCDVKECVDGEWVSIVMDCSEDLGLPCESGDYVPAKESECCSTCASTTNSPVTTEPEQTPDCSDYTGTSWKMCTKAVEIVGCQWSGAQTKICSSPAGTISPPLPTECTNVRFIDCDATDGCEWTGQVTKCASKSTNATCSDLTNTKYITCIEAGCKWQKDGKVCSGDSTLTPTPPPAPVTGCSALTNTKYITCIEAGCKWQKDGKVCSGDSTPAPTPSGPDQEIACEDLVAPRLWAKCKASTRVTKCHFKQGVCSTA